MVSCVNIVYKNERVKKVSTDKFIFFFNFKFDIISSEARMKVYDHDPRVLTRFLTQANFSIIEAFANASLCFSFDFFVYLLYSYVYRYSVQSPIVISFLFYFTLKKTMEYWIFKKKKYIEKLLKIIVDKN